MTNEELKAAVMAKVDSMCTGMAWRMDDAHMRIKWEVWPIIEAELNARVAPCTAVIHHGPGHQSCTTCERKGPHEVHTASPMGYTLEWRGQEGITNAADEAYVDD